MNHDLALVLPMRFLHAKNVNTPRHGNFVQRHPALVLIFCFWTLLTCMGIVIATDWVPKGENQDTIRETMEIIAGSVYVAGLALYIFAFVTKRRPST